VQAFARDTSLAPVRILVTAHNDRVWYNVQQGLLGVLEAVLGSSCYSGVEGGTGGRVVLL